MSGAKVIESFQFVGCSLWFYNRLITKKWGKFKTSNDKPTIFAAQKTSE